MQKYCFKVLNLAEADGRLEVQFEFLAGIYWLEPPQPEFAVLRARLLQSLHTGEEVAFEVAGTQIVAVEFPAG